MAVMTFKQAQKYVPKPSDWVNDTYENGTTQDIINTMLYAEKREKEQRFLKELAPKLRGANDFETCKNVFDFVRRGLKYVADPRGHEKVKSSRQTLYSGYADCKSYSILINSLLRELGIKYTYRFVSWVQGRDVSHVYPVATLSNGRFEFPVALDAIPDSCGFDCEIRYAYKKDYDFMTKISYIDGINAQERMQESSTEVPPQSPINFVSLTDGEAALAIARDRLVLLSAAHPDARAFRAWQKGIDWIDNAHFRGLHSGALALPTGLFKSREEQGILNFIKSAQKRFSPAQGDGIAFVGRTRAWEGIRELGHVGDIAIEDCAKNCTYTTYGPDGPVSKIDDTCNDKCLEKNKVAKEILSAANKSGHNFLYEFMSDEQLSLMRLTQRYKYDNHAFCISKMAFLSEISRTNVRESFKTEIMRANATREIGAMTPEDSINELIKDYNVSFSEVYDQYKSGAIRGYNNIGEPLSIAFMLILLVIAAVEGMVLAGQLQIILGKEPTAFDRVVGLFKIVYKSDGSTEMQPDPKNDFGRIGGASCPTGFTKDTTGYCIPKPPDKTSSLPSWVVPAAAGGLLLVGLTMTGDNKK